MWGESVRDHRQGKAQGKGEGKKSLISSRHIEGIRSITRGKKLGKVKGGRNGTDFCAVSFSCKGYFKFVKR